MIAKKLQAQKADEITQTKKLSSLYTQYIYRTSPKSSCHISIAQKYKNLYESEKKAKNQLLVAREAWEQQKSKLMKQRELFRFTVDTIMAKITLEEEQSSSKDPDQFDSHSSLVPKNSWHVGKKRTRKGKHELYRIDIENQNIKTRQKMKRIQALRILKYKLNENEEIGEVEPLKDNPQKIYDRKMRDYEQQIISLKDRIGQLELQIVHKREQFMKFEGQNQQIAKQFGDLKIAYHDICDRLQQAHQAHALTSEQLDCNKKAIEQFKEQCLEKENKIKILEIKIKVTQQQFKKREEKELECVQILQKFTNQLNIHDENIKEFLTNQIGLENQETSLKGIRKTYQQYISYILHLCKKKNETYEAMVYEFKQKLLQSELRLSLIERRATQFKTYYTKASQKIDAIQDPSNNPEKHLKQIIKVFRNY